MKGAVIVALWIGEDKPDLFSYWIQVLLTLKERRGFFNKLVLFKDIVLRQTKTINYSHNAFIYKGLIWHCTTPGGVKCEGLDVGLAGSKIRARKRIRLDINEAVFDKWLKGELGKEYCITQNLGHVLGFLKPIVQNGDLKRNCSEFLARACYFSGYTFPVNCDYVLPTDTFKVLKPDVYD